MFAEPEPLRLDGMRLCEGCEDVFVLSGYCPECKRLAAEYAKKEAAARAGGLFGSLPRVDAGLVAFDQVRPAQFRAAHLLVLTTAFALGFALSPFLFGAFKAAIVWMLAISH